METMSITKPITIDGDRWYVQRAGRTWLVYNGPGHGGGFVEEFKSWDSLIDWVIEQRKKEQTK